jgi:ubiquitin-conjugating enzyme E2 T
MLSSYINSYISSYPFGVPVVRFLTPLYHPNVDSAGRICLKSLKLPPAGDWSPSIMLVDLIAEIRMLLKHPNPRDSLMPDIVMKFNSEMFCHLFTIN